MSDECECGIPGEAVVLSTLQVVEYMMPDGAIYKEFFTQDNAGEELDLGKTLELAEWAKLQAMMPIAADMLHQYMYGDDDEDEDDS